MIIKKVEKNIETWDKELGIFIWKLITKSLCYNKNDKAFCNKPPQTSQNDALYIEAGILWKLILNL